MVSNHLFIDPIQTFHPNSLDYIKYWKEQKKRCIEGYWQSGKWIPPQLYFYVNHWHIALNRKLTNGKYSKTKSIGKPFLMDLEWERALIYSEAKGFSGFELDTEFHCIREVVIEDKKYIPAREYLRRNHNKNLGKALYENPAKNVFDLEAREGGKTEWAACIVAHNYLFDGALEYDPEVKTVSQGLISAINETFSKNLAGKLRLGLDSLEGGQWVANKYIPSPFYKVESGSLGKSGDKLINQKEIQRNGVKTIIGSGSNIWHRTFGGSEFAASGLRFNIGVIDEIGFMFNIKAILGTLKDCTYASSDKFGILWLCGTGGEMEGSAIFDVKDVFYNPDTWDCLVFDDIWEGRGNCGMFIPKYITLRDFKDEEGNTRLEEAKTKLENDFAKALATKDTTVINKFLLNSPLVPSHAFLSNEGSRYPIAILKEQLAKCETLQEYRDKGTRGFMKLEDDKVKFEVSFSAKEVPFPFSQNDDLTGCVVIYEEPEMNDNFIPNFKYIASTDPYVHDGKGNSLGSTHVYKRSSLEDLSGDILVASYAGRPKTVKEYNEQVRLLCIYYNASNLYENQFQNLKEHFENKGSLSYLAKTPSTFKSTVVLSRNYGINRTKDLALEFEQYSADWLEESNPRGGRNVDYIYDKELLKELISYDGEINTDRAISFQILIAYKIHLTNTKIREKKQEIKDTFFSKKFFL